MRFAIFGNSGSGKSTLAAWLSEQAKLPVLDLDTVAWMPKQIAVQRPVEDAVKDLRIFCQEHSDWIVEGCYANLIRETFPFDPTLVFLNPEEDVCLEHCHLRPWEPHKFRSKSEQDKQLLFLLKWTSEYYVRGGETSLAGHRKCFEEYSGPKVELKSKLVFDPPSCELLSLLE